ncbi:MAG: NADH-quinone oxidoreductase subunit NuoF [Firmicutes bacterium]|nr:NADH-quinone oxidoreductase subunit NuoF [Bacillota bacterium]
MTRTVLVCCGTGCLANGSKAIADKFEALIAEKKADARTECFVKRTGCNGFCENGPLVKIMPDDIIYYKVKLSDVEEIIDTTLIGGKPVERLLYKDDKGRPVTKQEENPFYAPQLKTALRNIGFIDPLKVEDYLAAGGYEGLKKALTMTQDEIIEEVKQSGLRGRGGAGFPTWRKWQTAREQNAEVKYVGCNGDEGDPGAFMDRSVLEGDPHTVLEGLAIAALAVGAEEGFLYISDEYALAVKNVTAAIKDAEAHGFLGDNVMGSGRKIKFSVVRGGGAFVCGEETALIASVEGKVGEPKPRPPFPAIKGAFGAPTTINNVETLANLPVILRDGGKKFASVGTEGSKGTKVFALVGKVKRTGLVEIPMGVTLRHLIYDIGGGIQGDRPFKAVQTGGPSGGCIPENMLDLPVDFDTLKAKGAMMGSGGMIVMDDRSCMVEVARYYIEFLAEESCGKCTPCREGLRQMLGILTDICEGRGKKGDIELLESIGEMMQDACLCALGKTAANPVLTTIKYFRDEYEAHISGHRCPAGVCTALTSFKVEADKCKGCTMCAKACPVGAVSGEVKKPHKIDPAKCIACGSCREACRFGAISTEGRKGK